MFLKYFDAYVSAGFKPIALSPQTKKPVELKWNKNWTAERWRKYFETGDYNIGILLGNIIDVEADCRSSNKLLNELIGSQKHIKFQSYRSTHHLFINDDSKLRFLKIHGIEFRGYGLHSVVPPSIHQSGYQYNFCSDNDFLLTYMSEGLNKIYSDYKASLHNKNKVLSKKKIIHRGSCKTKCNKCNDLVFINKKRLSCEVIIFSNKNKSWLCHKCRDESITAQVKKMLL